MREGEGLIKGEARGVACIILRDRRFRGNKERRRPIILGSIVIFSYNFNKY